MEAAIVIWWFAGVICGIAFAAGLATFFWNWKKKHTQRLIFSLIAIGLSGMANSIFSILRLIRASN